MKIFVALTLLIGLIVSFNTTPAQAQFVGVQQPGPSLILFYPGKCNQLCRGIFKNARAYAKTETGKKFPLLLVNMIYPMPNWLKDAFEDGRIKKEKTFPTLIKWDGEKEIGRLTHLPEDIK